MKTSIIKMEIDIDKWKVDIIYRIMIIKLKRIKIIDKFMTWDQKSDPMFQFYYGSRTRFSIIGSGPSGTKKWPPGTRIRPDPPILLRETDPIWDSWIGTPGGRFPGFQGRDRTGRKVTQKVIKNLVQTPIYSLPIWRGWSLIYIHKNSPGVSGPDPSNSGPGPPESGSLGPADPISGNPGGSRTVRGGSGPDPS